MMFVQSLPKSKATELQPVWDIFDAVWGDYAIGGDSGFAGASVMNQLAIEDGEVDAIAPDPEETSSVATTQPEQTSDEPLDPSTVVIEESQDSQFIESQWRLEPDAFGLSAPDSLPAEEPDIHTLKFESDGENQEEPAQIEDGPSQTPEPGSVHSEVGRCETGLAADAAVGDGHSDGLKQAHVRYKWCL